MEITKRDKAIAELLSELTETLYNSGKVRTATFFRQGRNIITNKTNEMREYILQNAEAYGQELEFIEGTKQLKSAIEANILRNYELTLKKFEREYNEKYKAITEEKELAQMEHIQAIRDFDKITKIGEEERKKPEYAEIKKLEEEAEIARNAKQYGKVKEIVEKILQLEEKNKGLQCDRDENAIKANITNLENAINKCEEELKKCETEMKERINKALGTRESLLQTAENNYLAIIKQQNIFQKIWNGFLNKLNGKKRYMENITNPLSKKVDYLEKKVIPVETERISKETKEIKQEIEGIKQGMMNSEIEESKKEKAKTEKKNILEQGEKINIKEPINRITNKEWSSYGAMFSHYRTENLKTVQEMKMEIEPKQKTLNKEMEIAEK